VSDPRQCSRQQQAGSGGMQSRQQAGGRRQVVNQVVPDLSLCRQESPQAVLPGRQAVQASQAEEAGRWYAVQSHPGSPGRVQAV